MAIRLIAVLSMMLGCLVAEASEAFVEAEGFSHHGGWVIDQQFMDRMGSPYLMAHGLGVAVEDAVTEFEVSEPGKYYVYARTYNWTSPWTSKPGPGAFRLKVDGRLLPRRLGCTGNRWQWQLAGTVRLAGGAHTLALHDLSGFDGRCDAIYLSTEPMPADSMGSPGHCRRLRLRLNPPQVEQAGHYDLVVVGGGIAGMCAAATAARLGARVALVNDRPVWGGNNSSEVRVHLGGIIEMEPYKGLGRIIREFGHAMQGNAQAGDYYEDAKKDSFLAAQPNLTLFPSCRLVAVEKEGSRIGSVTVQDIRLGRQYELRAHVFSDCTGDGTLGFMAGADYRMGREARHEYGESLAPAVADTLVQGSSCQWYSEAGPLPSSFPEFSYGVKFGADNCERVAKGEWTWETGMNRNQVDEAERIRDYAFLVVYSNWSWLKNHDADRARFARNRLAWVAYILGKRESRRLMGDYVLSEEDINKNVYHEDASFVTTWAIDVHTPDSLNSARFPGNEFKSRTVHRWIYPYAVPYRCLYSRNVDNLFMAGRDISCTHVALGTVRVMRTTGMMGEVVGMAASICSRRKAMPRDVYRLYLPELRELMRRGAGRLDAPDNQRFNEPNQLLEAPRAFLNE